MAVNHYNDQIKTRPNVHKPPKIDSSKTGDETETLDGIRRRRRQNVNKAPLFGERDADPKTKPGLKSSKKTSNSADAAADVKNTADVTHVDMSTVSRYASRLKKLRKLAYGEVFRDDKYFLQSLYALLDTCQGLLPIAESAYRKTQSERAIHPITHLTSLNLELMALIRNYQGTGAQTQQVLEWTKSAMTTTLHISIDSFYAMRAEVLEKVPKEYRQEVTKAFDAHSKEQVKVFSDAWQQLEKQISDFMLVSNNPKKR